MEGAAPGDTLEVEIVDIRLRSPYGWMMIEPGTGAVPEDFPYRRKKGELSATMRDTAGR